MTAVLHIPGSFELLILGCVAAIPILVVVLIVRLARQPTRHGSGFPVAPAIADGPGRYKVRGVIKDSGADMNLEIEAQTLANAKVKAELKGIIVTDVQKLSDSPAV